MKKTIFFALALCGAGIGFCFLMLGGHPHTMIGILCLLYSFLMGYVWLSELYNSWYTGPKPMGTKTIDAYEGKTPGERVTLYYQSRCSEK